MRSDTQRNRRQLVKAAGRLFATANAPVSMSDIAKAAEISPATAYRHFASVEDVLAEFRFGVGEKLREFSIAQSASGLELLDAVSRKWISLVVRHGGAMVHTRSGEGYLARLNAGTYYLTVQAEALDRPLAEACDELGIRRLGHEAMFLWNILFDPREIFDLRDTLHLTQEQLGTHLLAALTGALGGWAGAKTAASPAAAATH